MLTLDSVDVNSGFGQKKGVKDAYWMIHVQRRRRNK